VCTPFYFDPLYSLIVTNVAPRTEKQFSANFYATFHLPDRTELTAGTRYIDYREFTTTSVDIHPLTIALPAALFRGAPCALVGFKNAPFPGYCNETSPVPGISGVFTGKGNPWVWDTSLSHKFTDDVMAYAHAGSAWRPPGFQVGVQNVEDNPVLAAIQQMKPEKSWSIEGGIKTTWLDNRVRFNADYYHEQFSPIVAGAQTSIQYLANSTGAANGYTLSAYPFPYNANAIGNGIEGSLAAQLTKQWSLDVGGSWVKLHFANSLIPCNPTPPATSVSAFPAGTVIFECPSNGSVSTQPSFTGSARTEYVQPITDNMDAFIRALFSFYGRNPNTGGATVVPAYGLLNLYLGIRSPDGHWEVNGFAKNLLNTQKILFEGLTPVGTGSTATALFGPSGYTAVSLTPRQQFGVTVTYAFGSR
jgi:iron complex outermembrane receptor protein